MRMFAVCKERIILLTHSPVLFYFRYPGKQNLRNVYVEFLKH